MRSLFSHTLMLTLLLALLGPDAARAARHRTGQIALDLTPSGGAVFLDGRQVMTDAPAHARLSATVGRHHVRVEHAGFETFSADVEVAHRRTTTLHATLIAVRAPVKTAADLSPADAFDIPAAPSAPAAPAAPAALARKAYLSVAVELLKGDARTAHTRVVFADEVAGEIGKLDGIARVLRPADLVATIKAKKIRPRLTCNDDESCLTNAAGIDELITGSLTAEGKGATLSLSRIELRTGKTVKSVTRRIADASAKTYAAAIGPAVQALYGDHPLLAGRTRGASADALARFSPPPLPRVVFCSTATAAAALLITGAIFEISSADAQSNLQTLESRGAGAEQSPLTLNNTIDQVATRKNQGIAILAAGGGVAVAAVVEYFFTDWHDARRADPPVSETAPVAVRLTPAGVALSWR